MQAGVSVYWMLVADWMQLSYSSVDQNRESRHFWWSPWLVKGFTHLWVISNSVTSCLQGIILDCALFLWFCPFYRWSQWHYVFGCLSVSAYIDVYVRTFVYPCKPRQSHSSTSLPLTCFVLLMQCMLMWYVNILRVWLFLPLVAFATLLVGRQEGHPAHKNPVLLTTEVYFQKECREKTKGVQANPSLPRKQPLNRGLIISWVSKATSLWWNEVVLIVIIMFW